MIVRTALEPGVVRVLRVPAVEAETGPHRGGGPYRRAGLGSLAGCVGAPVGGS